MAIESKDRFINLAVMIGNDFRRELQQERKHINNRRCKPANWEAIASFLNDPYFGGFNPPVTEQDVIKWAHEYNWGD